MIFASTKALHGMEIQNANTIIEKTYCVLWNPICLQLSKPANSVGSPDAEQMADEISGHDRLDHQVEKLGGVDFGITDSNCGIDAAADLGGSGRPADLLGREDADVSTWRSHFSRSQQGGKLGPVAGQSSGGACLRKA